MIKVYREVDVYTPPLFFFNGFFMIAMIYYDGFIMIN